MTDEPTMIEHPGGYREWWLHGERHRTDGPAIEHPGGSRSWWLHGERHRTDGPAIEHPGGYRSWWLHGKLHRTDGPAVERPDGTREWWLNGKLLRTDDPAIKRAAARSTADLLALLVEDPAAGILAVADLREQRVEAEANPALVDAGVVRWRGVVERHESLRSDWPTPVCRWCSEGVDTTGHVDMPIWWPCPDFRETAGEARAYLGGVGR